MIHVKQNDRRPAAPATIKHGTSIVDLTDATSVTFKATMIGRVDITIEGTCTILVAANGTVEYRWAVGDTANPGTYYVEWEVIWSDGTPETFPTLGYDILRIGPDLDGS